jgi:hypothetical protein
MFSAAALGVSARSGVDLKTSFLPTFTRSLASKMFVATFPGHTTLTLIPKSPASNRSARESAITAALLEA